MVVTGGKETMWPAVNAEHLIVLPILPGTQRVKMKFLIDSVCSGIQTWDFLLHMDAGKSGDSTVTYLMDWNINIIPPDNILYFYKG